MLYPNQFETKIGFDKIRNLLKQSCISPLGEELVSEMLFITDYSQLAISLKQCEEYVRLNEECENFPIHHFIDTRRELNKIRVEGAWMDCGELFALVRSLENMIAIVRFFQNEEIIERYPELCTLTQGIILPIAIVASINRILDKFGRIKDNASPTLLRIRTEITKSTSEASRQLNSILRSAQTEGYVEKDASASIRDGRLVIPISPSYKRKIKGIVHDESATGKTVYIEPDQVVEINNRIRTLEGEEKREVIKILTSIADEIRPHISELIEGYKLLSLIDFIRAKALFSKLIGGSLPSLTDAPLIDWRNAIHPLLHLSLKNQGKTVIPLDVLLDSSQRILLISGPNAGGKSVCLKTVGLVQYMMQCGILPPISEHSKMGLFKDIFIDIGDEQSIENDLSTYSSHLTNMKYFIKNATNTSLILVDEFGGGTEPQIGGAIAESLLERFAEKGSFGVITTHYQNLKHFAEEREGLINGAMLYDRHQMQPLFRLAIGRPGSSFAIEIARKIGLPDDVITDAEHKVGSVYVNMDKYLQDIVRDKNYWEKKRGDIRLKEKRVEQILAGYEKGIDSLEQDRKSMIKQAKQEAQQLIADTNAIIERTIRTIKESQADKQKTKEAREELRAFKEEVEQRSASAVHEEMQRILAKQARKKEKKENPTDSIKKKESPVTQKEITIGSLVTIIGEKMQGKIISINNNKATVAFGSIKSIIDIKRLVVTHNKSANDHLIVTNNITLDDIRERKLNFRGEIDIRGFRGDEALQAVGYYIDDAMVANVRSVRILHGTGSGILRQLIREYLSSIPSITYHDEHVQYGGAGITIVEFD